MKITKVEPLLLDRFLYVRVSTDAGITGIGESGTWGQLEASAASIAKYGEYLIGKDPFPILRSRDGRTTIERGGATTESERPFVDTLRTLMADFRSPFVPDLPRFTGGAVGYLGYGAASWFEPTLGDLGASPDSADDAGFMLFDTVLAFDHVQHRILIIANARITPDEDLESPDPVASQHRTQRLLTVVAVLDHLEGPDSRRRPIPGQIGDVRVELSQTVPGRVVADKTGSHHRPVRIRFLPVRGGQWPHVLRHRLIGRQHTDVQTRGIALQPAARRLPRTGVHGRPARFR